MSTRWEKTRFSRHESELNEYRWEKTRFFRHESELNEYRWEKLDFPVIKVD